MSRLLLLMCLAFAAPPDDPADAAARFREGVERLRRGEPAREQFAAAAKLARAASPDDSQALRIGNAHYLAGNLPEAIAAYHAGLAADPFNEKLRRNLGLARHDVVLAPHLARPSAGLWFLFQPWLRGVALGASGVAVFFLMVGWRGRMRAFSFLGGVALAITFGVGALLLVRARLLDDIRQRPVVVVRVETPLRAGNAAGFESLAMLPAGYEVRRIGERGGWLHVECPDGALGWIPQSDGATW